MMADLNGTESYSLGASYSNTSLPLNIAGSQSFNAVDSIKIGNWIKDLHTTGYTKVEAIEKLKEVFRIHKDKGPELGLLLRNSIGALTQEVILAHEFLSPIEIGFEEMRRVCNALVLIQCIASHPHMKMELVKAHIPEDLYPYLKTIDRHELLDKLRENSLGVILALLKEPGSNAFKIVRYLLDIKMIPECLRCMVLGGIVAKSVLSEKSEVVGISPEKMNSCCYVQPLYIENPVFCSHLIGNLRAGWILVDQHTVLEKTLKMAVLVLGKILEQHEAKAYLGSSAENFYLVSMNLCRVVNELSEKPPDAALLLRHILICYLRLTEVPSFGLELIGNYPTRLTNSNLFCDETTRVLADQVWRNIMVNYKVRFMLR